VRGWTTKWVLKKAAEKSVPHDVIYRRKRGLSVSIAGWINRGLRAEVDRLLEPSRLRSRGLVDEPHVTQLLAEHRSGRANHAKALWTVVMLEYWLEQWADHSNSTETNRTAH
jgi:asparagine synthase (glutamine-hydrolysing)